MLLNNKHFIYYLIIAFGLIAVLFSNPFLRYPYDMFTHLIFIDEIYHTLAYPAKEFIGIWANDIYVMLPTSRDQMAATPEGRKIWHYIWANIFNILHVDSSQIFLRAKIIHVVQTYITLFSMYYFSKVIIRNVFQNIEQVELKYLSLWSVIIWLSIFATFSVAYHQVWVMWYSVNYQITLPLFWYITALTLVLFLEETSGKKKLFFIVQILILSRFILQAHSMEFMYYLMYVLVFSLVFIDKLYLLTKKYFYLFIPAIFLVGYFIQNYQPENSKIFNYLSFDKFPLLYEKIMHSGRILMSGYNRASSSMNELMYLIGYISMIFIIYIVWRVYKHKETSINTRMILFIGITSLFVLIPLYQFSGGLFGLITKTMVVNRLYYSSSLFVLLPIIIYYIGNIYSLKLRYVNLMILLSLVSVTVLSKHSEVLSHNYYKNIQSIKNSFFERRVGFNLDHTMIVLIGEKIKQYEKNNQTDKTNFYYARADIAFVLKYIYKKDVYWEGRRANPNQKKIYENHKANQDFNHILFKTPETFPIYKPYT